MAAPLHALRVLLVDDTPFMISLVRGLLGAAGVNEYLIKPFTASGVLGRLAASVNQARGPAGRRLH